MMSLHYRSGTALKESVTVEEALRGRAQNEKIILIVEDDEDLGALILEALQQEGIYTGVNYRTLLAVDGLEALEITQQVTPHLFLLDYYLPRMNGLDLYDRLHAIEALAHIPTIFMSANPPLKELKKRSLLSVRKPFNLRELLHTIEWLLADSEDE